MVVSNKLLMRLGEGKGSRWFAGDIFESEGSRVFF